MTTSTQTTTPDDEPIHRLDDREHRLRCLDLAIRTEPSAGFQETVKGAEKFYAFVTATTISGTDNEQTAANAAAADSTTAQKGS